MCARMPAPVARSIGLGGNNRRLINGSAAGISFGTPMRGGGPTLPRSGLRLAFALSLFACAASCVSPEELRREDEATCAGYGFHPGTDAFATCLQRESLARRALTSVSAAVLGVWGILGAVVGVVLAVAVASSTIKRGCFLATSQS
jgi:hypothetical protein